MTLTFGSLFAGIGGFDLGFERAGMVCQWQVEIDDYATKVLEKHWPHVPKWRDVRTFPPMPESPWTGAAWRQTYGVDVIAGGFPCQDISNAGKQAGIKGNRSGLWSEFARIIRLLKPRFVVIENVGALLVRGIETVLRDLAEMGLNAEWRMLRASQFGAGHRRERVFIVSYSNRYRVERRLLSTLPKHLPRVGDSTYRFTVTEPIGVGSNHGIPCIVDRIRCTGNAVVPQVAQWIGERIVESGNMRGEQ